MLKRFQISLWNCSLLSAFALPWYCLQYLTILLVDREATDLTAHMQKTDLAQRL